jgi:hypothetical protein
MPRDRQPNQRFAIGKLIDDLTERGVLHLPTEEELRRNQLATLARFARHKLPSAEWEHLQACDGSGCPHSECSLACHFGERHQFWKLVSEADDLLTGIEIPLWFVTFVEPHYRVPVGRLESLSINAVQQSLRRRFDRVEDRFGKAIVVGAIEASFDVDQDGSAWWSPHAHAAVGVEAPKDALRETLQLRRRYPEGTKPVMIKPVYNLANAIAYSFKRDPAMRVAVERNGRGDRDKTAVRAEQLLEYDRWLLRQKPTERLFLRRIKRVHGRLTLIA